jgi:hypothetical protein
MRSKMQKQLGTQIALNIIDDRETLFRRKYQEVD